MAQLHRKQTVGIKTESTRGTRGRSTTDFTHAYDVSITPWWNSRRRTTFPPRSPFRGHPGRNTTRSSSRSRCGAPARPARRELRSVRRCRHADSRNRLRRCLVTCAPTSSAASSNFYGPGKSATVKIYRDGMHVAAGCLFDVSFDLEGGKTGRAEVQGRASTPRSPMRRSPPPPSSPRIPDHPVGQRHAADVLGEDRQNVHATRHPDHRDPRCERCGRYRRVPDHGPAGHRKRRCEPRTGRHARLLGQDDERSRSRLDDCHRQHRGQHHHHLRIEDAIRTVQVRKPQRRRIARGNLLFNRSSGDDEVSIVFT